MEKPCTKCGTRLAANRLNFPPHKQCRDGLGPVCRPCHNERMREWKRHNRDRLGAKRRADYAARYGERQRLLERTRAETFPLRVQAARLMGGVRERSKELGFKRSPELKDKRFFVRWLESQPSCPCCGVMFAIGPKFGEWREDAPSVDRFDSSRGYDLDNIALICWRCNNIKRNYAAADLRRVADWMDVWGNEVGKFDTEAA